MRLRVLSSLPIGSCTPVMPRSPQITPQAPIGVSKIAKCWPVMASSLQALPGLIVGLNVGLEIVAIHPDSERNPCDQQAVTRENAVLHGISLVGAGAVPWKDRVPFFAIP